MHNCTAEQILCLVTSREHAAAIVGDLIESSAAAARPQFWLSVIRIASSLLWRGLCADPTGALFRAFWGLLQLWFLTLVGGTAVVTLWIVAASRFDQGASSIPFPSLGYQILAVAAVTLLPYYIGWTTARESKHTELASALYLVAVIFIFHVLFDVLSAMQVERIGEPFPGREHALLRCISESLFVLAGALSSRKAGVASPEAKA